MQNHLFFFIHFNAIMCGKYATPFPLHFKYENKSHTKIFLYVARITTFVIINNPGSLVWTKIVHYRFALFGIMKWLLKGVHPLFTELVLLVRSKCVRPAEQFRYTTIFGN